MRLIAAAWIPGNAKTKGSMELFGRKGQMRESVAGSTEWKTLMTRALVDILRSGVFPDRPSADAAIRVDATCFLSRPATAAGRLPAPARGRLGDLDKLMRNLLDAAKDAGVYPDDEQVVDLLARKRWADPAKGPGIRVLVYELDAGDL